MHDRMQAPGPLGLVINDVQREFLFANAVEALSDDFLGESISMPPGAPLTSRTRFDMLMSVKEHEMHHRGQLMLTQRLLGMVPPLTRQMEERVAAMKAAAAVQTA